MTMPHLARFRHIGIVGAALGLVGTGFLATAEAVQVARHSVSATLELFAKCRPAVGPIVECLLSFNDIVLAGLVFNASLLLGMLAVVILTIRNFYRRYRSRAQERSVGENDAAKPSAHASSHEHLARSGVVIIIGQIAINCSSATDEGLLNSAVGKIKEALQRRIEVAVSAKQGGAGDGTK
jgi:hypothetical protein